MEELRIQLASLINESHLPFECKFYVLKDVYNEVNNIYRELLKQEKESHTGEKEETQENSIEDSKE